MFRTEADRNSHIDRLAAEGMVFSNYYTGSPVSAAARCVL